jgi:hypothetical protein
MTTLQEICEHRDVVPVEVTGYVKTVSEKTAGRQHVPWATARFHGIDLDLNLYPRLWGLYWRDVRPGARLTVTGLADHRWPSRMAVAVRDVKVLGED